MMYVVWYSIGGGERKELARYNTEKEAWRVKAFLDLGKPLNATVEVQKSEPLRWTPADFKGTL